MNLENKEKLLYNLNQIYVSRYPDTELVLGRGNINPIIMLIGEAPGKYEIQKKEPFVGAAGKILTDFLLSVELKREDIYISNVFKYRLSKISEKTGREINRPAKENEIISNIELLMKEIEIISPEIVVTLGNVPLKAVINNMNASVGEMHGKLTSIILNNRTYKYFPLYHPASIIYNRKLKDTYDEDMLKLKSLLTTI